MIPYETSRYRDESLTLANHAYRGRSIGSEATCHQFPGYSCAFDIGGAPISSTVISQIFLTHGHDDHCGGIGSHHLRRNGWGLAPAQYFAQAEDVPLIRAMVRSQADLNRSRALRDIHVTPVNEGDAIPLAGASGLVVRPFRSTHRIPCMGYSLWGQRKRLRADMKGASKEMIMAAKARGEDINEIINVPEIAFPGDTNLALLDRAEGDVVRKARLLLLECTFVDGEVSPQDTFRTGHVHIEHFVEAARAGAFENEIILLTHFSARYMPEYVWETVTKRLQDEAIWPRVRLLLPDRKKG